MNNNKSVNEYIFPKFDPMTCTIQELTMHWKDYTNSEPIWNEVRDEIFQEGRKTGLIEALDILVGERKNIENFADRVEKKIKRLQEEII